MRLLLAGFLLFALLATGASAQNLVVNLLTPLEAAQPGGEVRVDLVILNPTSTEVVYETPLTLEGRLTRGQLSWPVLLRGQAGGGAVIAAHGFSYRSFVFTMPKDARGRLALELDRPQRVRAVVDSHLPATPEEGEAAPALVSAPLSNVLPNQPAATAIQRTYAGRFKAHEPVYFIYGSAAPSVKFQYSFKYRFFGDEGALGAGLPALRALYLGYTQRSLWDIHAVSSPFYDTSYMPELLFESQHVVDPGGAGGMKFLGYQAALKHESNGKDGLASRSLNIAYVRAAFAFGRLDSWNLLLVPRVFTYLGNLSDNPDIATSRGLADVVAIFGRNDGPALSVTSRLARRGAWEADLTLPLRSDKFFDFATYFLIQYWDGYGESLLDYNRRSSTLRAGFSLVR
ncbi:MAG: phospholipase A [Opitutales bacterium]